jgi:hypothetical protein
MLAALILCSGSTLLAQDAAKKDQRKIVRASTLNSVKANQEFQRNVKIVQAQRDLVVQLKQKLDDEKDKKKKAEIQKQMDAALKKLNDNNKKMTATYGFSLTRNYVLVTEKAHIYMIVSDEEAAKVEANAKKKAAEKKK